MERERLRAAIYVRVSSSHQGEEGTSLHTQEVACRELIAERGWSLDSDHVYVDVYTGSKLFERPALSTLLREIRTKRLDVVVCYALDRLTRDTAHVSYLMVEAQRYGTRFEFVTGNLEDTPEGKLMLSITGHVAEMERQKILERTTRGKMSRVKDKGLLMPGGKPPYGYMWPEVDGKPDRGRLIINPDEAPIVERIFDDIAKGKSQSYVTRWLEDEGIPTPSGKAPHWRPGSINRMLHSPYYKGVAMALGNSKAGGVREKYFAGDKAYRLPDDRVPAIVDPRIWDLVQARLKRNKEISPRNALNPELGLLRHGYLKCGYCGYNAHVRPRAGHERGQYYCGNTMRHRSLCGTHTISTEKLDSLVWERVEQILLNPDLIARRVEELRGTDPTAGQIASMEKAIAELDRKKANLVRNIALFDDPEDAAPLVQQITEFSKQRKTLGAELENLYAQKEAWEASQQDLSNIEDWCQTVAANLRELTYEEKRIALEILGVKATFWEAKHDPQYRIEMAIQPQALASTSYSAGKNIRITFAWEG